MAARKNIAYQTIQINVPTAGAIVQTNQATLDTNYSKVVGIAVNIQDPEAVERGTFDAFMISSTEIYPKGFEAKLLSCGIDVPPNDRFDRKVDEVAKGAPVNISYIDGSTPGTTYPYKVNIVFELHNTPHP